MPNTLTCFDESGFRGQTLLVGLVVCLLTTPACLAETPVSDLVPANAVFYVATQDARQLEADWQQTRFSQFWHDDQSEAEQTEHSEKDQAESRKEIPGLGISWEQILQLSSGEVCLALLPSGQESTDFLILLDVSQHQEEVAAFLKVQLAAYADHQAARLSTKKIAGIPVEELVISSNKPNAETSLYYFSNGDVLGVTNREEVVGYVAEQLKASKSAGLTSTSSFREIMKHCQGKTATHLQWYVDPWRMYESAEQPRDKELARTLKLAKEQGFQVVSAVGGTVRLLPAGYDLEHRLFIVADEPREKAFRMFSYFPLGEEPLPNFVPQGISQVRATGWNLLESLAGYGSWFDASWAEGIEGTFDAVLEDFRIEHDGPQVDISEQLSLQEGPVIEITCDGSIDPKLKDQVLYAVKVKDERRVAKAVKRMMVNDAGVKESSIADAVVWTFQNQKNLPPGQIPLPGPNLAGCALSVTSGYFFASSSEALLEKVLTTSTENRLIDDKMYQEIGRLSKAVEPEELIAKEFILAGSPATVFGFQWLDPVIRGVFETPSQDEPAAAAAEKQSDRPPQARQPNARPQLPGFGFTQEFNNGWLISQYFIDPEKEAERDSQH